jgi:hypothetical protein
MNPSESLKKQMGDVEKLLKNMKRVFGYLDVIKGISFEHGRLDEIDRAIKKAERSRYIIFQGGTLEEEEKLSLSDVALLQKSNKLKKFMDELQKKGVGEELSKTNLYRRIIEQNSKVKPLQQYINDLFKSDSDQYQSGDVLVTEMDKTKEYGLKNPSFFKACRDAVLEGKHQDLIDKIKGRFTKYGHAAQLTEVDGKIKQSHMWGEHHIDEFTLKDAAESDIFRVRICKLVKPAQIEKIKAIYGEQWQEELQKLYAAQISKVSQDKKLEKLKIIGGIDAAPALLPDVYYYLGEKNIDYQGLFSNDRLHKNEVICSDFVAREIVESMKLVNQELIGKGLDPIASPIPLNVNLDKVAPERLIKLLRISGCLEVVEAKELNAFLRSKSGFYSSVQQQSTIYQALYDKVISLAKRCPSETEFVREAKIAFVTYLISNDNLSRDAYSQKKDERDQFLSESLTKLFKRSKHSDNYLIQFFCNILEKLHLMYPPQNKECKGVINEAMIQFKVQAYSTEETIVQEQGGPRENITSMFQYKLECVKLETETEEAGLLEFSCK